MSQEKEVRAREGAGQEGKWGARGEEGSEHGAWKGRGTGGSSGWTAGSSWC